MAKVFINLLNLPQNIVMSRIRSLDPLAEIRTYTSYDPSLNSYTNLVEISSTLDDGVTQNELNTPVTVEESTTYQNVLDQLVQIETATNPTNLQVIAAIKFLAKTLRLIIKLFIRFY